MFKQIIIMYMLRSIFNELIVYHEGILQTAVRRNIEHL